MKKKIIREVIRKFYNLPNSLRDVVNQLEVELADAEKAGYTNISFESGLELSGIYEEGSDIYFEISGERLESDSEYDKRIRKLKREKNRKEAAEKMHYEIIKQEAIKLGLIKGND